MYLFPGQVKLELHFQAFDPLQYLKWFLSHVSSFFERYLVSPLSVVVLCSIACMGHSGTPSLEASREKQENSWKTGCGEGMSRWLLSQSTYHLSLFL